MKLRLFHLFLSLLAITTAMAQHTLNYIALELDAPSQQRVMEYAQANLPWSDAQIIAHHMTILHHSSLVLPAQIGSSVEEEYTALRAAASDDYILAWALAHNGETVELTATEAGHSDRAFALRITDTTAPSRNRIKHITLATHTAVGGRAVDSNDIKAWQPLPEAFVLKGKVTFYYK